MPDIVITEFMDEAAVADLATTHDVVYDAKLVDKPDEMAALVRDARAIIVRNRTQVRGAFLAGMPKLACVGRLGVGLDNIDQVACAERHVAVYPATGANDLSVAEWAITTAMMLLRGAYLSTADVIAGTWPRNKLMGRETHGKTLGLVGVGRIARETGRLARALGMNVIGTDPYVAPNDPVWGVIHHRSLDQLIAEADVISVHVPLTSSTANLIDAARIAAMKPGAIVLNAARGGVVDEAAVATALKAGTLGGAALDVFEEEPLSAARAAVFAGCPNLILTPHIAGVAVESNTRVSWVTIENVRRHLGGL
jgi:(S)-sulfolactate dehydrogenase